jgi:hypothetical protein
MKRFLPLLPVFVAVSNLVAQTTPADDASSSPATAGDAAGGAVAGLAALGCGIIPCVIWLAIIIGMAVFVYKDATKRGMENAILLTILTAVTGPLGLIIYLVMRPKGPVPPSTGV